MTANVGWQQMDITQCAEAGQGRHGDGQVEIAI
jgi:hypothetical protein